MDLEYYFSSTRGRPEVEIGIWLDQHMPNPPLPEPQRWTLGEAKDGTGRSGIQFANEEDATLFLLRWP